MTSKKGKIAPTDNIFGDKLFQQRAVKALPILVQQASDSEIITYSDLADKLEMPNPRNLNYVLGYIGDILQDLSKKWKEKIPPIQSLVVNKNSNMPGAGISPFLKSKKSYRDRTRSEKSGLLDTIQNEVFDYEKWADVLEHFGLTASTDSTVTFEKTVKGGGRYGSGGESEEHKQLKKFISKNPHVIGLKEFKNGKLEHCFPSSDTIDVYFSNKKMAVGVEVKSKKSDENDILRGLFQCKKYEALIEAENNVEGVKKDIMVILALESKFPRKLLPEKNILSVHVIDNIRPV
ncbi:MAG: hypothetical protein LBC70_00425 [Chitinispirillales bacterium]|jgi:hypothetical protein|nr:hypothetical protein [Chitinispirillales bacterium]